MQPVVISKADLRMLCDKAEAKGYPTGPVHEYWDKIPDGLLQVTPWLHGCMGILMDEAPYNLNGGFCIRVFGGEETGGYMRADIDLLDWQEWKYADMLRKISKASDGQHRPGSKDERSPTI